MGIFTPKDTSIIYVSAAEGVDNLHWHKTLQEAINFVDGNGEVFRMTFAEFENLTDNVVDPDDRVIEDYQPVWECWE